MYLDVSPVKEPSGIVSREQALKDRFDIIEPDSTRQAGYTVSSGLLFSVRVEQLIPL